MKRARSLSMPSHAGSARRVRTNAAPPKDGGRRRASLIVLLALVALLFQSLVTGSHVHAGPAPQRAWPGIAATSALGHPAPSKPGECAICREIAQAGHYVSAAPPLLEIGALAAFWLFPIAPRPVARRTLSHAWQSRGPPQAAPF